VRTIRDARFDEEAERFRLAFTCEECGNFDPLNGDCAHEWPNGEHRRERLAGANGEIVFCKEFEAR